MLSVNWAGLHYRDDQLTPKSPSSLPGSESAATDTAAQNVARQLVLQTLKCSSCTCDRCTSAARAEQAAGCSLALFRARSVLPRLKSCTARETSDWKLVALGSPVLDLSASSQTLSTQPRAVTRVCSRSAFSYRFGLVEAVLRQLLTSSLYSGKQVTFTEQQPAGRQHGGPGASACRRRCSCRSGRCQGETTARSSLGAAHSWLTAHLLRLHTGAAPTSLKPRRRTYGIQC